MANKLAQQDHIANWFLQQLTSLQNHHQRRLVSLQGSYSWSRQILHTLQQHWPDLRLLSDQTSQTGGLPFAKCETLLGQEADLVVVDLYDGLNADVLCIAAGSVKCGGLLVLLSPSAQGWSSIDDQYGIWQDQKISAQTLFVDYFFDRIEQDKDACIKICEGRALAEITAPPQTSMTALINGKTPDQAIVLQILPDWLNDPQQRFLLITANRGRGKSTCLGFIAQQLSQQQGLSVLVSAYSRQSAAMLLAQFPAAEFIAPDELINQQQDADLLIVDEAAMLPHSMLSRLCDKFKRVIMATTTGGYEGTGQGFMLRFVAQLPAQQLLQVSLQQPVRWGLDDCLENWLESTLRLKSDDAETAADGSLSDHHYEYMVLDQPKSKVDLSFYYQIYQLMVSAHYRTRPSDLRALMENPDLFPILATPQVGAEQGLSGICLLNREGGFDDATCEQVALGKRRPKGHLLAQMLTAQAGLKNFASFCGLRIQRIAVQVASRRKGIGAGLIRSAESFANKQNDDYIGASFALDAETAEFWRYGGFDLVHISFGQGKSTGSHSVAVIKVINPELRAGVDLLRSKVHHCLPLWLCQYLQDMDVASVIAMLRLSGYSCELDEIERHDIEAFSRGQKGFELCFVSLQKAVMQAIAQSGNDKIIHPWLIEKLLQNRDWKNLSPQPGYPGRKSMQNFLRGLVSSLLEDTSTKSLLT